MKISKELPELLPILSLTLPSAQVFLVLSKRFPEYELTNAGQAICIVKQIPSANLNRFKAICTGYAMYSLCFPFLTPPSCFKPWESFNYPANYIMLKNKKSRISRETKKKTNQITAKSLDEGSLLLKRKFDDG